MQLLLLILMAYPANGLMFLEPSQTGYHLQKLEDIVRCELIPNLTGRPPPNDSERLLMALPARLGGLGITNPSLHSDREFSASLKVISPLKKHIATLSGL